MARGVELRQVRDRSLARGGCTRARPVPWSICNSARGPVVHRVPARRVVQHIRRVAWFGSFIGPP